MEADAGITAWFSRQAAKGGKGAREGETHSSHGEKMSSRDTVSEQWHLLDREIEHCDARLARGSMIDLPDSSVATGANSNSVGTSVESMGQEVPFGELVDRCQTCSQVDAVRMGAVASKPFPLEQTLLETSFPFRELSLVINADRRTRDPIYGVHRWWARRPPALLRGLLIASHLDTNATTEDFWRLFSSAERPLAGQRVLDPFAGGGSTLVEAARLGANIIGSDVDPLAVRIVGTELTPPQLEPLRRAGAELLAWLHEAFAKLYPAKDHVTPLHYFHVPIVKCPNCQQPGPLYRNLVLVRDPRRRGAVIRDDRLTCFCPICFSLRQMQKPDAVRLQCCGKQQAIWSGTFTDQAYSCPECGTKSSHRDLQTGAAA